MTARVPRRRDGTAAELAAEHGVTPRTIRNHVAEPRDDYLARSRTRRQFALALRAAGYAYQQIAVEMGTTVPAVKALLHRARNTP